MRAINLRMNGELKEAFAKYQANFPWLSDVDVARDLIAKQLRTLGFMKPVEDTPLESLPPAEREQVRQLLNAKPVRENE